MPLEMISQGRDGQESLLSSLSPLVLLADVVEWNDTE